MLVDSDRDEEGEDDLVTSVGLGGHRGSGVGQMDRFAWFFGDQSFFGEAVDDPGDGDMRDSHALGEVADACGPGLLDELCDRFDIVLGGLVAMCGSR